MILLNPEIVEPGVSKESNPDSAGLRVRCTVFRQFKESELNKSRHARWCAKPLRRGWPEGDAKVFLRASVKSTGAAMVYRSTHSIGHDRRDYSIALMQVEMVCKPRFWREVNSWLLCAVLDGLINLARISCSDQD